MFFSSTETIAPLKSCFFTILIVATYVIIQQAVQDYGFQHISTHPFRLINARIPVLRLFMNSVQTLLGKKLRWLDLPKFKLPDNAEANVGIAVYPKPETVAPSLSARLHDSLKKCEASFARL